METSLISGTGFLKDEKLYIQRARQALPILVRQAMIGRPIFYSDLALELNMPNARNLNYVLGAIGNTLLEIGKEWGEKIPYLQSIVLNKATNLPGEGIAWFIENKQEFLQSSKRKKEQLFEVFLTEIYLYPKWLQVLDFLGIAPYQQDYSALIDEGKHFSWSSGESEAHRTFKEWVFKNPQALNLPYQIKPLKMEYVFLSQDAVDVAFKGETTFVGVEVKSKISRMPDILRGLFQCVKYHALIQAEQLFEPHRLDSQVILALEGAFPSALIPMKNQLGVEVIDNLGLKKTVNL